MKPRKLTSRLDVDGTTAARAVPRGGRVREPFEVAFLSKDDYAEAYKLAFAPVRFSRTLTKPMLEDEFGQFNSILTQALRAQGWTDAAVDPHDFELSDEWQGTWHHCGGIYSHRIHCPAYVEVLLKTIKRLPHAALWTYHTACESEDAAGPFSCGEFFVRDGRMYVACDGNDYAAAFAPWTRRQQARAANHIAQTNIHAAAEAGKLGVVRRLLAADPALLEACSNSRSTPLDETVRRGHTRLATWLLQQGASVRGAEILQTSVCSQDQPKLVSALLEAGADAAARDYLGHNALDYAAFHNRTRAMRVLLRHGADPNASNECDETALFQTACSRTAAIDAARLLLARGSAVDGHPSGKVRPLCQALKNRHLELARLLAEAGADLDAPDGGGQPPLHVCFGGSVRQPVDLECARLLLERGADPNGVDKDGNPLLPSLFFWKDIAAAQLLLQYGADPDQKDAQGKTARAIAGRQTELCRLLRTTEKQKRGK